VAHKNAFFSKLLYSVTPRSFQILPFHSFGHIIDSHGKYISRAKLYICNIGYLTVGKAGCLKGRMSKYLYTSNFCRLKVILFNNLEKAIELSLKHSAARIRFKSYFSEIIPGLSYALKHFIRVPSPITHKLPESMFSIKNRGVPHVSHLS